MYSKVPSIINRKSVAIFFFILLVSVLKPVQSKNVDWTPFSLDGTNTTQLTIYSNHAYMQIQVDIQVNNVALLALLELQYNGHYQFIGSSGGQTYSYTILANNVQLSAVGAADGQYRITELDSGANIAVHQMGAGQYILIYFVLPIVVSALVMGVIYISWRRSP